MRILKNLLVLSFTLLLFTSCARRVVVREPVPSKVVVVKTLPRQYKVVRVNGNRYYKFNGKHYRKTRRGYVVVKL